MRTRGEPKPALRPILLNLESVASRLEITALTCSAPGRLKKPDGTIFCPHTCSVTGTEVVMRLPRKSRTESKRRPYRYVVNAVWDAMTDKGRWKSAIAKTIGFPRM